jgi:putative FmdB family regulatory protein
MPIYEYRCDACGHEFDELQKLSDAPLQDCPKCGKPALIKKVSAAGFQLKGTGWYATDFKGGKKAPAKDASGEPAGAKPESGGATPEAPTKADTKPETKAETKTPKKPDAV